MRHMLIYQSYMSILTDITKSAFPRAPQSQLQSLSRGLHLAYTRSERLSTPIGSRKPIM